MLKWYRESLSGARRYRFFILTEYTKGDTIMADNRIAYGLAKKYGIDTRGMSPKEVWEALKGKGIT